MTSPSGGKKCEDWTGVRHGKIGGGTELTGRQGRKCKQLLEDVKEMRWY
jgi:hypothetical protein